MDMEARDIYYALGAYVLQYLFASKNEDPKEIIFPKFPSISHPRNPSVLIPIKYVEVDEPIVQEIIEDGKDIPITPIEEVPKEEEPAKEEVAKAAEVANTIGGTDGVHVEPELSPAKAALEKLQAASGRIEGSSNMKEVERKPRIPASGDIGSGHPDGIGSRDVGFDKKIATDLKPEAKVDESKELETDIEKPA